MNKIALIGSGDFAEQVIDLCTAIPDKQIVGLYDGNKQPGTQVSGFPVLGDDNDVIPDYKAEKFDSIFTCIGYAQMNVKQRLYERFVGIVPSAILIHPTAVVNPTVQIGANVLVKECAIIGKGCIIEDNVTIEQGALLSHDDHISRHCFIAGRTAMAGCVTVGEKCFIGMNSSIRDHVSIGNQVTVGIGCVVISDIPDDQTVVGNPQRSITMNKILHKNSRDRTDPR